MENQKENALPEKPKVSKIFTIGIIVSETNLSDIAYYNAQFREINRLYSPKLIRLLFFGYKPENDKIKALDGVIYEYVKPVSIIHYFKQINVCEIDILFVPLAPTQYNITSEGIEKFLTMGLMKAPLLVADMYPYQRLVQTGLNGFLYKNRDSFIESLKDILKNKLSEARACGKNAQERVAEQFDFNQKNMDTLIKVFAEKP